MSNPAVFVNRNFFENVTASEYPPEVSLDTDQHETFSLYSNTVCMNIFLKELSDTYSDDFILLCCDGAAWHKSATLEVPENIELFFIPPYTPEMNPIEQIWKELRQIGFRNEIFATLDKVVDRFCDSINALSKSTIMSITGRDWILRCFK